MRRRQLRQDSEARGKQDVEPEVCRQFDLRLEFTLERVVEVGLYSALSKDLRPAGALSLQFPVRGPVERLPVERGAQLAIDMVIPGGNVEQRAVEVKDKGRRPLPRHCAPPTRLERPVPGSIRSCRGTACWYRR